MRGWGYGHRGYWSPIMPIIVFVVLIALFSRIGFPWWIFLVAFWIVPALFGRHNHHGHWGGGMDKRKRDEQWPAEKPKNDDMELGTSGYVVGDDGELSPVEPRYGQRDSDGGMWL